MEKQSSYLQNSTPSLQDLPSPERLQRITFKRNPRHRNREYLHQERSLKLQDVTNSRPRNSSSELSMSLNTPNLEVNKTVRTRRKRDYNTMSVSQENYENDTELSVSSIDMQITVAKPVRARKSNKSNISIGSKASLNIQNDTPRLKIVRAPRTKQRNVNYSIENEITGVSQDSDTSCVSNLAEPKPKRIRKVRTKNDDLSELYENIMIDKSSNTEMVNISGILSIQSEEENLKISRKKRKFNNDGTISFNLTDAASCNSEDNLTFAPIIESTRCMIENSPRPDRRISNSINQVTNTPAKKIRILPFRQTKMSAEVFARQETDAGVQKMLDALGRSNDQMDKEGFKIPASPKQKRPSNPRQIFPSTEVKYDFNRFSTTVANLTPKAVPALMDISERFTAKMIKQLNKNLERERRSNVGLYEVVEMMKDFGFIDQDDPNNRKLSHVIRTHMLEHEDRKYLLPYMYNDLVTPEMWNKPPLEGKSNRRKRKHSLSR